ATTSSRSRRPRSWPTFSDRPGHEGDRAGRAGPPGPGTRPRDVRVLRPRHRLPGAVRDQRHPEAPPAPGGAARTCGGRFRRRRRPPIPYAFLLLPMATAITLSLATQGVIGAFWCYPIVIFFYFVLRRPVARLCSLALLVVATLWVHHYLTMRITVRFVASL